MTKLRRYLKDKGIPVAAFARGIGVHPATAYRYVNGERVPEPSVIPLIYEWSGGEIQPNDFYQLPEQSHAPNGAGSEAAA